MTEKRRASDIFLELWQWRALDLTPEQFTECAEAWRQIVSLEEIYAAAERRQALKDFWEKHPAWSPIMPAPTEPCPVTCAEAEGPGDPSPAAQDDRPGHVTYDCASAPMPDPAEAAKAAARSAAGVSSLATRKRRALERLEAVRERGVSMADVAAAGSGLTLNDVLDAVARKPLPLPKLAALEKALTKLEEADTGGGESA